MRVHELAKELNVPSKDLVEKLLKLKIDVKNHMSVIAAKDVETAKSAFKAKAAPAAKAPEPAKAAAPAVPPLKKAAVPTQTPSIESVKQAFLAQRLGARPSTPEVKRPVPQAPTPPRRPIAPPTPPRPKFQPQPPRPVVSAPQQAAPAAPAVPAAPPEPPRMRPLTLDPIISVKDLADKLNVRPNDLIARLIKLGVFASINQTITFDVASKILPEMGYEAKKSEMPTQAAVTSAAAAGKAVPAKNTANLKSRAPVVTFMGHVDHGKTSLLDAIRKTKVAAGEAGGITQHIGAYEVFLEKGAVTFLDTPGHEAFTAMRARGARATDVVVLVVAADDGVMPQTVEAIDHAKAANVPIVVAINKVDLPSANPERVKKELMEKHELMPEDWGGKTVMVPVSAKTGKGIDNLLEMLALESELLELRADPTKPASGVVIEAELSKGSGVLAHVLVQEGTLRIGDVAVVGSTYGKIRAMINDRGARIKEALPSMPVEILGLPDVPKAGDRFEVVKDERAAKEIVEKLKLSGQADSGARAAHVTLEHLLEDVKSGKVSALKLILKSDVQGSVEALRSTLGTIQSKNVKLDIIHTGTGDVSESDVMLAAASDAVVIGFHVGMSPAAAAVADREQVDVRFYQIIYEVKTAIEKSMEGLLEPEMKEVSVGVAEVRQVFKVSKIGTIAGCSVQKGKIVRNFPCRVVRAGQRLHEGKVESLKRFKDDAREVLEGFECGIGVSNFDDLIVGDRIEVYEIQKKARKLE